MTSPQSPDIIASMQVIAREAGGLLMEHFGRRVKIEYKGSADLVTIADRQSEALILERIREELKLGKTVRSSIDAGYDKAFVTIVDSHVTTLITAAALFLFGTGPVKGFAVTLSLGVAINLFSALVGTRVVYDWMTSRRELKRLSI